jgi:hypothetical protein
MKTKQEKTTKSMMSKAAKLGVSRSTLYSWKEAGAPTDKSEAEILAWAMAETKRGPDTDAMRTAKLGVLRETERRLKIANDDKTKSIVRREDVEHDIGQLFSVLWQCMDNAFGNELPPLLVSLDAHQIASRLDMQLQRFKGVLRVEWKRVCGEEITPADYEAVKLSIEAIAALRACEKRSWEERIHHEWTSFLDWKRKGEQASNEARREWCQKRAEAGLPVPNATDQELRDHPGLKRKE